jgi:hypothetical protein
MVRRREIRWFYFFIVHETLDWSGDVVASWTVHLHEKDIVFFWRDDHDGSVAAIAKAAARLARR